jgi:GTPase
LASQTAANPLFLIKYLDEERVIVDDVEGTTRDSIDSTVTVNEKHYRFIDTAGLKKNKLKEEDLEFYSKIRTYRSIEKSQICLVMIDSTKQITNQDQKIVELMPAERLQRLHYF